MPLIGNVNNIYNYYSDTEKLIAISDKLNYIDMALQAVLDQIQLVKDGLALVGEKLTIEKEQIATKFAEFADQLAALNNSDALLAAAADLEANVVGALAAMATEIEGIIPDATVEPPVISTDPVDPPTGGDGDVDN